MWQTDQKLNEKKWKIKRWEHVQYLLRARTVLTGLFGILNAIVSYGSQAKSKYWKFLSGVSTFCSYALINLKKWEKKKNENKWKINERINK